MSMMVIVRGVKEMELIYKRTYNANDPKSEVPEIRMQPPADALVFTFSNPRYYWTMYGDMAFASVAVNSDGIWYLPRKEGGAFLAWSEVANLTDDENGIHSCLVLTDQTGSTKIKLGYYLEDFDRLRELVIEHTAATRCQPPIRAFHRTWLYKMIFCFGIVFFLCLSELTHSQRGLSLAFLGFAVLSLVSFVQESTRVEIGPDAFVIIYPGWSRSIPFNNITGITLTNISNGKNVFYATVTVQRMTGKWIRLQKYREGSIALYEGLLSAWKTAGGVERPKSLADL
jgi:hypothetical protein